MAGSITEARRAIGRVGGPEADPLHCQVVTGSGALSDNAATDIVDGVRPSLLAHGTVFRDFRQFGTRSVKIEIGQRVSQSVE